MYLEKYKFKNVHFTHFFFYLVLGECGGHRDSSSGTIESPNYPNGYPVEQNCIWTVAVEGSVKNIKLSFRYGCTVNAVSNMNYERDF